MSEHESIDSTIMSALTNLSMWEGMDGDYLNAIWSQYKNGTISLESTVMIISKHLDEVTSKEKKDDIVDLVYIKKVLQLQKGLISK